MSKAVIRSQARLQGFFFLLAAMILSFIPVGAWIRGENPPDVILLDFTATWCGPCQQMQPIISKLEKEGYPIRKVDVNREPQLKNEFHIESIPTFVVLAKGREVSRVSGKVSEDQLRRMISSATQKVESPGLGPATRPPGKSFADSSTSAPANSQISKSSNAPATPSKNPLGRLFGKNSHDSVATATSPQPRVIRGQDESAGDHEASGSGKSNDLIDPELASVRIRVKDAKGIYYGSGTVVLSQPGRSVIVTCGHVFREISPDATVEVDLFRKGIRRPETIVGTVIDFDLKADVGLLSIPTSAPTAIAKLLDVDSRLPADTPVFSMGCSGGDLPTREEHMVTGWNRVDGPDNVECTGMPVLGRSGGGLFTKDGRLVGVCIGADRNVKRGFYCAVSPIGEMLEKHQFSEIVSRQGSRTGQGVKLAQADSPKAAGLPVRPVADASQLFAEALANATANGEFDSVPAEKTAPRVIDATQLKTTATDAEVICIIRPRNGQGTGSRVVIVNQASDKFVNFLLDEVGSPSKSPANSSSVTAQIAPGK